MPTLMSDAAVIQRVLDHAGDKTTDLSAGVWREPVGSYTSQDRVEEEMELFKRVPMVFCPSTAIAKKGAYVARSLAGVPIIAVRGDDDVVRAFHNSCRHRGMMLAEGCGNARSLLCPYHARVYGLDGTLKRMGGEDGFPDFDQQAHGLIQVVAEERGGLLFVTQKQPLSAGALGDLPDLIAPGWEVFEYSSYPDDANWKRLLETSMDGYHIAALHRTTFYPYGFDNLNVVEAYGTNSRIVFPFRCIEKLREIPKQKWRADGMLTYVHQLFPNTRLAALSNHYLLVILEPTSPTESLWIIYRLRPQTHSDEDLEKAKRDAAFVKDNGVMKVRAAARSIQLGLAGASNTHFTFGRYEAAAVHFHQHLSAHLEQLVELR